MNPPLRLELSIDNQLLRVVRGERTLRTFTVSTGERGAGFAEGSFKTPYGRFEIAGKIGAGMPIHTVFKGRKPTGVWSPEQPGASDLILTRILRIRGLDTENSNTWQRYIYLHGTNHEESLGTPSSHGCIRMGNRDIIELFDMIPEKTPLLIHPPGTKTHPRKTARNKKNSKNLTLSVTSPKFSAYSVPAMSSKNKTATNKTMKKTTKKKAAKKPVTKKATKKAAVKKTVVKKTVKNTDKGKRYTPAEKQKILNFVEAYNKKNGRGGQTAAAAKFGVAALTIAGWIKAAGKGAKKPVAKKAVKKPVAKKAKKPAAKKAKKARKVAKKPAAKKVANVKKAIAALKSALAALNA